MSETGCRCDACKAVVAYDLIVPDELWTLISPKPVEGFKGGGVLCPNCILDRAIAAERERCSEEIAQLRAALRPFEFRAHPDQFQSTDDGMTEALVCDADVQRARELGKERT